MDKEKIAVCPECASEIKLDRLKIKRVIIYHPEFGVYLGSCLGLGFWSKMDAAGQSHAITFESEEEAKSHIGTWCEPRLDGLLFCEVVPDDKEYALISLCEDAIEADDRCS